MAEEIAAKVTLEVDGMKITLPNNLSEDERHILIGYVLASNEYGNEEKCKIIEALIEFGRTQMQ